MDVQTSSQFWNLPSMLTIQCCIKDKKHFLFSHTIIEYFHNRLTWGKVFEMKNNHFHKMTMSAFSKKKYGKIWKVSSSGVQKWIYGLKYVAYFFSNIKTVTWVPQTLGWVNLKHLFSGHAKFSPLNVCFKLTLVYGAIFSAPNSLTTKLKLSISTLIIVVSRLI